MWGKVLIPILVFLCVGVSLEALSLSSPDGSLKRLYGNEQALCAQSVRNSLTVDQTHRALRKLLQTALNAAEARVGTPKALPTDKHSISVDITLLQQIHLITPIDCSSALHAP